MNDFACQEKIVADELHTLTVGIGSRLAGSAAEMKAAGFMAEKFRQYGADKVEMEKFPMLSRVVKSEKLSVLTNGSWQEYSALLLSGAPGTDGKTLEAEPVLFYAAVDYQRQDLSYLHGKAVIHYGMDYAPKDHYQRLMAAEPAFIIFVDLRQYAPKPIANGLVPAYVQQYGAVPCVTAAIPDIWQWEKDQAQLIRLNIDGSSVPAESVNVIAEYTGSDPAAGVIFTGSHLDSQAYSPGADDNGSGMLFQLALARELQGKKLRHTIRQIAFGTEEQLSVGSTAYVIKHRQEIIEKGRFMINVDSAASRLGWDAVTCCADKSVWQAMEKVMNDHGVYAAVNFEPDPFIDLLPFNSCGVPGVWLSRCNCAVGRFQHHSPMDDQDAVSPAVIALRAKIAAEFICKIDSGKISIPPLSAEVQQKIDEVWTEFFI